MRAASASWNGSGARRARHGAVSVGEGGNGGGKVDDDDGEIERYWHSEGRECRTCVAALAPAAAATAAAAVTRSRWRGLW
jgi:hypothetical protein